MRIQAWKSLLCKACEFDIYGLCKFAGKAQAERVTLESRRSCSRVEIDFSCCACWRLKLQGIVSLGLHDLLKTSRWRTMRRVGDFSSVSDIYEIWDWLSSDLRIGHFLPPKKSRSSDANVLHDFNYFRERIVCVVFLTGRKRGGAVRNGNGYLRGFASAASARVVRSTTDRQC